MDPLPSESPFLAEFELLHELRRNERLRTLAAQGSEGELQVQAQLRREFPGDLVRAALSLAELRRKAADKFSRADRMWFDRPGLDHATPEAIARHTARRFEGSVTDLCCGIGSQTIALAEHCDVLAVDPHPLQCLRTQWNAEVYDCSARVTTRHGPVESFMDHHQLLHIAPELHRKGAVRAVRMEDYLPGLDFLQRVAQELRGGAISLSPAANFGGKFPGAEIELVSWQGECKGATVWFGELAGAMPWRATMLPGGETITGDPLDYMPLISAPLGYIYDPDPAIVRAGLVDAVAEELGLARLDDEEEYLTGETEIDSPFVQGFELVADLGTNDREVRAFFRGADFGEVEIKSRHIRIDASAIRRKLPLPGKSPGVLIYARVAGKARALVCRRLRQTV